MNVYLSIITNLNAHDAVQLNGGLDYRSKLSNNASLTEGSYSKGIDAY